MGKLNVVSEILLDYTTYSSVQGLVYTTLSNQTTFGRLFWILALLLMFSLGCYWCICGYQNWSTSPGICFNSWYKIKSILFALKFYIFQYIYVVGCFSCRFSLLFECIVFVFLSVLTTIKTSALSVEQVGLGLWILK